MVQPSDKVFWVPVVNVETKVVDVLIKMPLKLSGKGLTLESVCELWPEHLLGAVLTLEQACSSITGRLWGGFTFMSQTQGRLERFIASQNQDDASINEFVELVVLNALDIVEAKHSLEVALKQVIDLFGPVVDLTHEMLEKLEGALTPLPEEKEDADEVLRTL